jgi:ubiquinone/menaquinone biosynthesis C-methylase UbiE
VDIAKYEEVQRIQADYRRQIANSWHIEPGAKLLEVGCGQGDMTAILADKVGDQGKVLAVDIASPNYGAPLTLGEATQHLKASTLGQRIDFRFEFDILEPKVSFRSDAFDGVVLAHSLWYFDSPGAVLQTLTKLREWSRRLFIAETEEQTLATETLQDADWEISACLTNSLQEALDLALPAKLRSIIESQVDALKGIAKPNGNRPLDSFSLTAE